MANGNPVILGTQDSSTKRTTVAANTQASDEGLRVQNILGTAMAAGSLRGTALTAGSLGGTAVIAESFAGLGVVARCVDTRDIPGISAAVMGTVPGGFGVLGLNTRARFPHVGVGGRASLDAIGVDGISTSGFGVRGMTRSTTASGGGVMGIGSPGHGVVGIATRNSTIPVFPALFPSPLFAGLFFGNVQVQGDFTVTGNKSAAVPHPDGSLRRVYCLESPEGWFEDFGTARLVKGRATVAFEKIFAPLIVRDDYHVFLTPEGDCRGLYVDRKTKAGFEVRELQSGASTLQFSFRVVARRRNATGERLEKVQLGILPKKASAVVPTPKPPRRRGEGRLTSALAKLGGPTARKKRARAKK